MHVLVTADTVGGVWTYTRELVTGLLGRGIEVTLVSFGEIPRPDQTEWMEDLKSLDYRPTAFRLEWMRDCEADLQQSSAFLLSIVNEVKPDVLHLSQFYYGDLACSQPRIVVAHSDIVSWWQAVHHVPPKDDDWMRWYRAMVARGVAAATAVVAPTQWMLESLEGNFGKPRFGSVIYNGRSPSLFDPYMSKENCALSVGRIWDLGKNSLLLTRIESPIPIYLAGAEDSPESPNAERSISYDEGPRRLCFKGVQSQAELRKLFARSAIYIATSQYEPFGLAPLEAALSRCAIIASDIPSLRELWGESVCYFTNNDPQSLEQEISRLQSDSELCATYGQLAYFRARQRFSRTRMVEDYLSLYGALVSDGVRAA